MALIKLPRDIGIAALLNHSMMYVFSVSLSSPILQHYGLSDSFDERVALLLIGHC